MLKSSQKVEEDMMEEVCRCHSMTRPSIGLLVPNSDTFLASGTWVNVSSFRTWFVTRNIGICLFLYVCVCSFDLFWRPSIHTDKPLDSKRAGAQWYVLCEQSEFRSGTCYALLFVHMWVKVAHTGAPHP